MKKQATHGGKRKGAGLKPKYNEHSDAVIYRRVPKRHVKGINKMIDEYLLPYEVRRGTAD